MVFTNGKISARQMQSLIILWIFSSALIGMPSAAVYNIYSVLIGAGIVLAECLLICYAEKRLNGNEKYGIISKKIPSDRSYSGNIEVGDLMLYGDDCIVLFYKRFYTPYSYTKLGRVVEKDRLQKNISEADHNLEIIFTK